MFTDWTMQDHRYFYARGVIYGVVLATMFWKVFVPWLCERFRKPNAHLSDKLRRRGIPHSPAQYDSAGKCLTCGEGRSCHGVHTFEEIQAASRRVQKGITP